MRCKKHIADLSSTVGVCATCLRERLISLIAAQARVQAQAQAQAQAQLTRVISHPNVASDECSRNSDPNVPPPLIFPRSVSPYVSRRKSDYAAPWHGCDRRERLFYSTPQLGPTNGAAAVNSAYNGNARPCKKRLSKFWIFSNLFRSRSEKLQSDPSYEQSSSALPSWFSTIFLPRRKNHDRSEVTVDIAVGARRRCRPTDRGMSPVTTEDFADECDQSQSGSGHLSESSPRWRRTPATTAEAVEVAPSGRRSRPRYGKSLSASGMAFCLSPLVRASPNRRWNHKGLPPEVAAAKKPHLSAAASFCANRSRKLADFGRVNQNR